MNHELIRSYTLEICRGYINSYHIEAIEEFQIFERLIKLGAKEDFGNFTEDEFIFETDLASSSASIIYGLISNYIWSKVKSNSSLPHPFSTGQLAGLVAKSDPKAEIVAQEKYTIQNVDEIIEYTIQFSRKFPDN